jgi:hypothetical protein
MMRALWVPDEGAGGALVGTLLAPRPKRVRPLTPDEKAAHAPFEDALAKMHSAGTPPPGAQGLSPISARTAHIWLPSPGIACVAEPREGVA